LTGFRRTRSRRESAGGREDRSHKWATRRQLSGPPRHAPAVTALLKVASRVAHACALVQQGKLLGKFFGSQKQLKKAVMSVVTTSESLEEPKEPEGSTVFTLYRQVAGEGRAAELAAKLRKGGYGWGHAKQDLLEALESELGPMRERYEALRRDEAGLDKTLAHGAERARAIARATMERVRDAIGIAIIK
jgi:hypothetical protein